MSQTKSLSLLESIVNVIIGNAIALASQLVIFGFYGIHLSLWVNIQMSLWFTAVSVIRSYLIRRFFNRIDRQEVTS